MIKNDINDSKNMCQYHKTSMDHSKIIDTSETYHTSSSSRASVISIPESFTYAIYIVIAFVLEVLYLAITLLLALFSISCWCTLGKPRILGCWLVNLNT